MKYSLVYTNRAVKDIKGLDSATKDGIGKTLLRYEEDPLQHARTLSLATTVSG